MPLRRMSVSSPYKATNLDLTSESLTLLLHTKPTFQAIARHSSWRSPARQLELRANVLLLLRPPVPSTKKPGRKTDHNTMRKLNSFSATSVDRLHVLSPSQKPFISRADACTSVTIGIETYSFPDATSAATFRDAVLFAISLYAASPYYIVSSAASFSSASDAGTLGRYLIATTNDSAPGAEQRVCIKSFSKEDIRSKELLRIAVNERICIQKVVESGVNSAYLPRFVHAFETRSQLAVATDVLGELGSLRHLLRRLPGRKLPSFLLKPVFARLLQTVTDAHAAGVQIGGLSPADALLDTQGCLRVRDLSRASHRAAAVDDGGEMSRRDRLFVLGGESTARKGRVGADAEVEYMAPEELAGKSRCAFARADAWSLGVVLYELALGYRPFGVHDGAREALARVRAQKLRVPRKMEGTLKLVLLALLAKDEARRASLRQVARMDWLRDVDWAAVKAGAPEPRLVELCASVGIEAHTGDGDDLMDSGIVDVQVDSDDGRCFDLCGEETGYGNDAEDEDDEEGDDAKSEWSRMTREFCRVDGVETTGRQGMKRSKSLSQRGRTRWSSATDDRAHEDDSRLLGFGIRAYSQ